MTTDIKDKFRNIAQNLSAMLRRPQFLGFIASLAVIAIISLAYFYPDATLGNEMRQHDMQQGAAIGQEAKAYTEATGAEQPRWTNSLFSGMPTFQISPSYPSDNLFSWINTVYGAGLPSPSNLLFMMMTGFLILMAALKVRWYYGLIGAIAWGFSTYFIIIIGAGHIWKFVTLAYIPPTIAGVMMAYRGRWLMGSALAALFAMMQIHNNHVQMSYYFMFVIAGLVIAYLFHAFRRKEISKWLKATGALAVAALLAVAANLPNLYNTYKYAAESMRGSHSELTDPDAATKGEKTSGLDRDYITQYSYGRSETFTLLIPDIKGGASVVPGDGGLRPASLLDLPGADETIASAGLNEGEYQYIANYVSRYFGEPEGTNGPVYVGVIIFTLFLLGCFIIKGPVKWALLALTLLSVFLALGRNMQWFTDLFIDYMPMYARFRTVESILVIAEFTIPLLAIITLQTLLTTPGALKKWSAQIYTAFGLTALICVAGWLFPGIYGPAITQGDMQISNMLGYQLSQAGYPAEAIGMFSINNPVIASAVEKLRYSMVSSDSLRSLIFILLAFGAVMLTVTGKIKSWMGAAAIGILVVADLYPVNKRYLNHESFCTPQVTASDPFPLSENDRKILADTAMNYRVMDVPRFYQAAPSYHHKAVGGYHAAKLTRYQDLIDRHLSHFTSGNPDKADFRVLNMLNARYFIDQEGRLSYNPDALGNAWFVGKVGYVSTPDAEMEALQTLDPATEAVADMRFRDILGDATGTVAPGDTIYETSYAPDRLTYAATTAHGGVAVFSEVFFPWGWECTIDDKPAELGRVNYLLRAVRIPAGKHAVEMTFRPESVRATVSCARISVILIYLLLAMAVVSSLMKTPKQEENHEEA